MARHAHVGEGRALRGPSFASFPELATYVARTPVPQAKRTRTRRAMPPIARILRSAVLVMACGGVLAAGIAFSAWRLLPYAALEAETFAERFFVWEGMMWGFGIAGTLFGIASLIDATDLYSPRPLEQVQQQMADAHRGRTLYSGLPAAPWVLLACGAALILAAVVVRSTMLG